jgi:hypothetical protein
VRGADASFAVRIAGRLLEQASREIRAEFHPLVTPLIPLVTRSSRGSDAAGHDAPRKEK